MLTIIIVRKYKCNHKLFKKKPDLHSTQHFFTPEILVESITDLQLQSFLLATLAICFHYI